MNRLAPDEVELVGKWYSKGETTIPDEVCERIKWLLSVHLEKVGLSKAYGAWETLYRDREDGRFWVRHYPQSEMHGGGPPALRWIEDTVAKADYKFESSSGA